MTNPPEPCTPVLMEAIVKKQAVAATYNRVELTLAPHILYTKHGDLHVDGVTLDRDGKPPREEKLGTFKLAGLNTVRLTPRRFATSALFEPGADRYADQTLLVVEPG